MLHGVIQKEENSISLRACSSPIIKKLSILICTFLRGLLSKSLHKANVNDPIPKPRRLICIQEMFLFIHATEEKGKTRKVRNGILKPLINV